MEIRQIDVKTAFLNGYLEEEIYMEQPPGFVEGGSDLVCKLNRSLYGLKQAPCAWYARLTEEVSTLGFTPSNADPALFRFVYAPDSRSPFVHRGDMGTERQGQGCSP